MEPYGSGLWSPNTSRTRFRLFDLDHARQHLWEVARQLHPHQEAQQKAWMKVHQKHLLDKGKIEKLMSALRAILAGNPIMAEKIRTEADYFERNAARMRYPQVSPPTLVCWLGCDRSWMQDRDRLSSQTIGNVLDRPGSQRNLGAALLSFQWPF